MIQPDEAVELIVKREFENTTRLIKRLCNELPYPVEVNLKVPTDKDLTKSNGVSCYVDFLDRWKKFPYQNLIVRRDIRYKSGIDGSGVPEKLSINSFEELKLLFSKKQHEHLLSFTKRVSSLLNCINSVYFNDSINLKEEGHNALYRLYRELNEYALNDDDFSTLCILLPQLNRGMGKDQFLRALPVNSVDTKFIERHDKLIAHILTALNIMNQDESLDEFLQVLKKPDGYVVIRALDKKLNYLFPNMMVTADDLLTTEPPGKNLIIAENKESGLMLPALEDTVVIFSTGNNVSFAKAQWLKNKDKVLYWGDIDSWGFNILSHFRKNCKESGVKVISVMMDLDTIFEGEHIKRMVKESVTAEPDLNFLTENEKECLSYLKEHPDTNRLEQEKLDEGYVQRTFLKYLSKIHNQ